MSGSIGRWSSPRADGVIYPNRFCAVSANNKAFHSSQANDATNLILGVSGNGSFFAQREDVVDLGIPVPPLAVDGRSFELLLGPGVRCLIEAGAAIVTVGAELTTNADGKAILASTALQYVAAIAIGKLPAAEGELFEAFLVTPHPRGI